MLDDLVTKDGCGSIWPAGNRPAFTDFGWARQPRAVPRRVAGAAARTVRRSGPASALVSCPMSGEVGLVQAAYVP